MPTVNPITVVGIGCSSAGVEAARALFCHLPQETGLAFVLVGHTARSVSALPEFLARRTDLPVLTAKHGERIKSNHIYVSAPDHLLMLRQGKVQAHPRTSPHQHQPIDVLLSSLAEELAENAIGIVLAGAGSDGTLGLKAIKEVGGLTIAQGSDGSVPWHTSMSNIAMQGLVDVVLPVEHIGEHLQQVSRTLRRWRQDGAAAARLEPTATRRALGKVPDRMHSPRDSAVKSAHVARLELHEMRERLHKTLEEHDTALEELKSANEELQSVNQQLQTLNQQMNAKLEELDRANNELRHLFESTQIATLFLDRSLIIRNFTPAVGAMFNLVPTDRGRPLTDLVSNLEDAQLSATFSAVMASGREVERQVQLKGGGRNYLMRVLPYRDGHDVIQGVVVTFVDVTSALEAETQQRTLIEELNHRVRNMLTVVNAMASQTIAHAPSLEAFAASFSGRIKAMASAYSLVSHRSWGDVELKELLTKQLQIYRNDARSVRIAGPQILLRPNAALSMAMVFHELTTNAVKYGALSTPRGTLEVIWDVTGDPQPAIDLLWREHGAPARIDTLRRGFGTELIERQLAHVLDAQMHSKYRASGLELRIRIPLNPMRMSVTRLSREGVQTHASGLDH